MAIKFLLLLPFISVFTTAMPQEFSRKEVDSMLIGLKKSRQDMNRIDLLLNLAQFNILKPGEFKVDFDSAAAFINEAKNLNKHVKSPDADGYGLLAESLMLKEKGNREEGKRMTEQAVAILEKASNKSYLGRAYYQLSMYYNYEDSVQIKQKIALVEKAITAFEHAHLLKEQAKALEMLGDLYSGNGVYSSSDNIDKSISTLMRALSIYDSIRYPDVQGIYISLGVSYVAKQNYGQGLFYELKALKAAIDVKDSTMQLSRIYNQLGRLYNLIGRDQTALEYLYKALEVAQKNKDEKGIFTIATNISSLHSNLYQSTEALNILSVITKEQLVSSDNYTKHIANICFLRAYNQLEQFDKARPYLVVTLELADKNLIAGRRISNAYKYVADYYFGIKQDERARFYLKKSVMLANKIDHEYGRVQGLWLTYKLDSASGDFRSAFRHLAMYKTKTDSITSENTTRQFQVLGIEYEIGMKEDSIRLKDQDIALLKERNNLQQANLRQASLVKNVTIGGIILAAIIISLLYRQYRLKQKTNNELQKQQDEIESQNISLRHLLDEKNWLLREIHHRVKNNLQIVMSLLNSQSAYIENDAALTAIHDSQHRVHAMSLIHQKLYNNENISSIEISSYIRELIFYLADSFDIKQRIQFKVDVEQVEMDVSQAVPLGLIINEAITNSIKYAFPDERKGIISVALSNSYDNHYMLTVSDNGIGIPDHQKGKKAGSLGMSLMKGLSEDIDGHFSIENKNGTIIKVSFEKDTGLKRSDFVTSSIISSN